MTEHLSGETQGLPLTSPLPSATSFQRQDDPRQDIEMTGDHQTETEISCSEASTDDEGEFLLPKRKKRVRKSSGSSANTTIPNGTALGNVVIFVPQDPQIKVNNMNPVKLTSALKANCPDGVISIRPNARLNILAVDTRNFDTSTTLLRITTLCGIQVRAYEPRTSSMAVGVIHGVSSDITEKEILECAKSEPSVVKVRRLGTSESVALTFSTSVAPDAVHIGFVRHKVNRYLEKPTQCKKCGRLGHVAAACKYPLCIQCGTKHEGTDCDETPHCVNCGLEHASTSRRCPKWHEEKAVTEYRRSNHVDYHTAKAAVKKASSTTAPQVPRELTPERLQSKVPNATSKEGSNRQFVVAQRKLNPRHTTRNNEIPLKDTAIFPPLYNKAANTDNVVATPTNVPTTPAPTVEASQRYWQEHHSTDSVTKENTGLHAHQVDAEKEEVTDTLKAENSPEPKRRALSGTSTRPPTSLNIGELLLAAINALRGFIQHLSSPFASTLTQIIDIAIPLVQGWLCH